MGLVIGLITVALVLNCIVLIFLVLIQLPKREAGLGLAFGGSAADALFGPGSGTVLTKATKYAATIFLSLCVALGLLQGAHYQKSKSAFDEQIQEQSQPVPLPLAPGAGPEPVQPPAVIPIAPTPAPSEVGAQQPTPVPVEQTQPVPAQQGQPQ